MKISNHFNKMKEKLIEVYLMTTRKITHKNDDDLIRMISNSYE